MITAEEKKTILDIAARYGPVKVWLFGSSLHRDDARDIDLLVEGVPPERFFRFYGEMMRVLHRPVDIVDATVRSRFVEHVMKRAVRLDG